MFELLAFRKNIPRFSGERKAVGGGAEIIFFPGVRYERMTDPVKPPKQRRTAKRRSAPKAKKVS